MADYCTDNRFEIIERYKKQLIENTNIETNPDEMAVIDGILFRFWQMGWLATDTNVATTDTISRQELLNRTINNPLHVPYITERDVLNCPPAQPGWIPTSERLPTENGSYLVWMPFTPEGHHITVAEWCGSYWNIKTPITAWMPLPLPRCKWEKNMG